MDNSLMVGLQTQRVLQRRLETTANNLANAATTGFKADGLVFKLENGTDAESREGPRDVRFVRDAGLMRDMAQGALTRTGAPLDLAIEGEGFFMVQGEEGVLYTRGGALSMGADGSLVTQDGRAVLNSGGAPIVFDAQGQTPTINSDGAISIGEVQVGQIGLRAFADPNQLEKVGDNLYAANDQQATPSDAQIVQGALEASNVKPILELTRLIEISRAYESAARVVRNGDDLRKTALERLGRAA